MGLFRPRSVARTLTIAAGVVAPCLAGAADLLPPPPMLPPPPIEVGGGWYLRGDVGVGALDLRRTIAVDASTPPSPYVYNRLEDRVGDQVFVGGGVGYEVNPWLRFDVTGEYRTKSDWRFVAEDKTYGGSGGYNLETGSFSSIVGLVNGYLDMGTWYGVTPFVGAGVGVAHHMFSSTTDQGLGSYSGGFGYAPAKDKTSFAWALHAGLGYNVTSNLKLELAYRYLNMGNAQTGVDACLPDCALKTVYKLKDLESQDVKIGFRYLLGGPIVAAAMPPLYTPEPGPIVRKY